MGDSVREVAAAVVVGSGVAGLSAAAPTALDAEESLDERHAAAERARGSTPIPTA
jgi:thioredoxin reductase